MDCSMPSPTPGACSNSCPSSQQYHPTVSSSVVPFSSCLQSFPASGSFPMSQFFASGGQRIGASVSASVLPVNIQDWFPLGWTGWIPLQSKGLSRVFSKFRYHLLYILESPLDFKEIQPVHSKGDQPWVFFGRTDAKAETPVLWPPHAKSWLIGKDFDAGRDWGQEEKGTTEDEMAGWHHRLNGCEFEWTPGDGVGQGGLACCDS